MVRLCLLALLFLSAVPCVATAQSAPEIPSNNNAAQVIAIRKAGAYFMPVAQQFDCDKFAWGNVTQQGLTALEYVPTDDNVENWNRLMTVTVFPLPQDPAAQAGAMRDIQTHLLKMKGKVLEEQAYHDDKNYPRLFIEYVIGEGLMQEHNAGTFLKTSDKAASFIQIQSRGIPFDASYAIKMKLFAEGKLPLTQAN